jgi:hypothetical protein
MNRGLWIVLLAALPLAAQAQMYKWKDERGQVHFTQVPPSGGQKYELIGPPPPPTAAPNQEALNQSLEEARKAAPEQQKAAEQAAQRQAQRQETCRQALERIAYLDARTPRRLGVKDADGQTSRMTDEEFQRQRGAEEERVKQNCD